MTRVWLCWPPQGGRCLGKERRTTAQPQAVSLPGGDCREVVIAGIMFEGRLWRILHIVVSLELPEMSYLFEKINLLVLASGLKQQLSSLWLALFAGNLWPVTCIH